MPQGYTANGNAYKVHLDGFNQSGVPANVSGTAGNNNGTKSARDKFFYSDDDGLLVWLRQGDCKYVFSEQRKQARWACGPNRSRRCACRRSST